MKKTLLFALVLALTLSFCVRISATNNMTNAITINNVDVVFDTNSSLTEAEKQLIAEHIVYGVSDVQTYGLICNLFGHKTTTEIVTTITHCVNSTVPRCLEEDWELIICSRCESIVEETRLAYSYRNCCPVD